MTNAFLCVSLLLAAFKSVAGCGSAFAGAAASTGDHTVLTALLLAGAGEFSPPGTTLLAPTDEAFEEAGLDLAWLGANPDRAVNVYRYHNLVGEHQASKLVDGQLISTRLSGDFVNVAILNTTVVFLDNSGDNGNATVTVADALDDMGCVLHVIDAILFPKPIFTNNPSLAPVAAPSTSTPAPSGEDDESSAPAIAVSFGARLTTISMTLTGAWMLL